MRRNNMRRIIGIIIIMTTCSIIAYGQRLIPHQFTLEAACNTYNYHSSIGGKITLGQYRYNGEWNVSLGYNYEDYTQHSIGCHSTMLSAGYKFFLLHNYKKSLILSAGGYGVIGYEHIVPPQTEGIVLTSSSAFIYGVAPIVSFDFFFHRYMAAGFYFSPVLAFGSSVGVFRPETGLSVKICLN